MNAILARILNRSIQRDLMDRGLVKNAQALGTAPRLISWLLDIPHDVHYSPGYSPHHLTSCGPQKPTSSPPSPSATASPWQPLFFSQPLIDFFFSTATFPEGWLQAWQLAIQLVLKHFKVKMWHCATSWFFFFFPLKESGKADENNSGQLCYNHFRTDLISKLP